MKPINTIPLETFMDKVKIASKTNQKTVNIDTKDAVQISESISVILARLVTKLSMEQQNVQSNELKVNADGGKF